VRFADPRLTAIAEKVRGGDRLSRDDGLVLLDTDDLLGVGRLADRAKSRREGDRVYFVMNRHITPTNVCVLSCAFCGFARKPGEAGAYEHTIEDMVAMVRDGTREVHIVGGHHPDWPFEYYERMIAAIHAARPAVQIKAFTAAEIDYFWRRWKIEPKEALARLKAAGLQSMPGGGAEIFSPRLAKLLRYTGKADPDRWCEIHGIAHGLGIPTNATMLYGHLETPAERVDHLLRLRAQQDVSGGFLTFVPLAYQTGTTRLVPRQTPPADSLRTIAAARLLLDNFPHVEAYWVVLGEATASIALNFGADDVNGTLEDERIQHLSGAETPAGLAREQLFRMIRDARKTPVERDALYTDVGGPDMAPPTPPRSGRPGGAGSSPHHVGGPDMAPHTPQRSGRPGGAGSSLDHALGRGGDTSRILERIRDKALAGERLDRAEGRFLLTDAPLLEVGALASEVRFARLPGRVVTFVIDSNPNYTNVCVTDCQFCAFYRKPGDPEAWTLSVDEVLAKVESAAARGATTVLLQGGHNPALPLDYYLTLVRETRRRFPRVTPHFFTASEIRTMAEVAGLTVEEVLDRLWEAGQRTIPGGGAEILSARVRARIEPKKGGPETWLSVHRAAHRRGFRSTATMMYGHVEQVDDVLDHLDAVRSLQDEHGGFTAFVPWSFKPGNTLLEKWIKHYQGPNAYLRMLGAARLYLDNVPHVQASWFSEGKQAGQVALHFGADDWGGTLFEENVHKAAAYVNTVTVEEIVALIREAGFTPAQRTTEYEILQRY
jgi:dehypoxanthine futalosine cyclase/putative menaquinone biosynthesis radical SAM enzyme